jgi:very-short-patch-repair endonuclease
VRMNDKILALCESPIERALLAALLRESEARSVHVTVQLCVLDYRIDIALTRGTARVAVEVDGMEFHERTQAQAEHDRARDRRLKLLGWDTLRYTGSQVNRDPGGCAQEVFEILDTLTPTAVVPAASLISPEELLTMADTSRLVERRGITTISPSLDRHTGGIERGDFWVFAADTGFGKSTYATAIAVAAGARGIPSVLVSSEDPPELYARRIERCLGSARPETPTVAYLDARGVSAELVAAQVAGFLTAAPGALVIYDYLQEFRSGKRHPDRRIETEAVAAALREPTRRLGGRCLLLSQVTPIDGQRVPTLHWVRESRGVSNAADVVVLGFSPDEDILDHDRKVMAERGSKCIALDKNKFGPKGLKTTLPWDDLRATFRLNEFALVGDLDAESFR